MTEKWRRAWGFLRQLSGDDAYERYLAHRREMHGNNAPVMNRAEFVRDAQHRKWQGINRCC